MKSTLPLVLILIVILLFAGTWFFTTKQSDTSVPDQIVIQTFAECVAAGNPVLESYPEQCRTATGELFTNTQNSIDIGEPGVEPTQPTELENSSDTNQLAAMTAVRERAAIDFDIDPDAIDIITVTEHEWPDGCLGLATADEACIMMLTYGYEITIAAKENTVVYRTDQTGAVVRKK
jgi:hypothetical protein